MRANILQYAKLPALRVELSFYKLDPPLCDSDKEDDADKVEISSLY
ncbi:MAG: hypothetical protein ABSG15_00550 [FCB group bacterium]|jgi:hypothetical protein